MKNLELILPEDQYSMRGAGVVYKEKRLITHTTLHHSQSALLTFIPWQVALIIFLICQVIFGLILNPLLTVTLVIASLSAIYFIDVVFNLIVILKSLYFPPELTFNNSDIKKLSNSSLPTYSILCPLYREANILPNFLDSIENLDWPKKKLDVILLLEEDDRETIAVAASKILPAYIHVVIVPNSEPKTKPKACNYGLNIASGEYLVIFDAEDRPEPDQLKKAYLAFQQVPENVVCLQAKLNYFNPHQNLLTRLFTAEYSLWFDVILTGLQSINTAIPLGGTSNHFKTKILRELKGWDPFNVTEDCDLGIRLFKNCYKTAVIDSTTWEEANSNTKNWLRQRSRWIKGYLQTFLVHNRNPLQFVRQHNIHAFITSVTNLFLFQLIIGARMSFMLINPILWLLTISYFTLYAIVGPTIESFYPAPVFYMAAASLVFGNFMYIYNYMIGCAKRRQWSLVKFVYLIPFYWLMASVSTCIAFYQLLTKPHYWEKTIHGLHLEKKEKGSIEKGSITEAVIESEESTAGFVFPWKLREEWAQIITNKKTYVGGFLLVAASVVANFMNFVFNAYLGRVLEFKDFALIGLTGALLSFASILFGAFSTTVNFRNGFLIGKYGDNAAYSFWKFIRKRVILISMIITGVWLISAPLLNQFFYTGNIYLFLIFGIVFLVGLTTSADRGFLSAKLAFGSLSIVVILDPLVKLLVVAVLVYLGLKVWAFSAVSIAMFVTFIVAWILIKRQIKEGRHDAPALEIKKFPKKFFSASLLMGFSSIAFLTTDILLANYFLSNTEAGKYTLLSLVGKMVYFMGGLTTPFVIPLISRNEGANKSSAKTLYIILFFTSLLSFTGFVAFGLFGYTTIPVLYGEKALSIVPYLIFFTLGITAYSISKVLVNYYLVKRVCTFTVATFFLVVAQFFLISLYHSDFGQISMIMSLVWGLHLLITTTLHFGIKYVRVFEKNVVDLLGLFTRLSKPKAEIHDNLRILIFNWRDTKHKWAGGAEVYIHELAKRWVKDGNNVTLFSGNGTKRRRNEKIDGVQIYRRGGFFLVYIWAFLYYIFKFRGKYDVIIDCENGIPFFTPLYTRKPTFLLIHHVHQEVFIKSLIPPFAQLASFLEAKVMPLVYKNVQVITVSPSSKEEILKHKLTATDPVVIYNGVDLNKFKPAEKSKNPMILYLGRLQYYKSLQVLVKAAKQVLEQVPNARFVIAGEGGEKNKLIKRAKRLGILEKISFLGKVSERKKIELFQKAWMFVNPSFMEGWGITTIEANACGTPAIASDVPGLRDSIRNPHTGILVSYGKSNLFAEQILKLIKDIKLRENLSREAIEWANNFTWEKSATEFYSIVINKVGVKEEKVVEKAIVIAEN